MSGGAEAMALLGKDATPVVESLTAAIERDGSFVDALALRAGIRLGNEYDKAFADLTKVLELRPKAVGAVTGCSTCSRRCTPRPSSSSRALNVSNTGSGSGGFDALEEQPRRVRWVEVVATATATTTTTTMVVAALPLSTG